MVADFFTKSLQGKRFQLLRDLILNQLDLDSLVLQYRSMLGNSTNNSIVQTNESKTETVREFVKNRE
jgi:hypothetical protein